LAVPLVAKEATGRDAFVAGLCPGQFALLRNTLMLFVCTFDAIFKLAPIVWKLFGHFIGPAWHIATNGGPEHHDLADMEFMRGHRATHVWPSSLRFDATLPGHKNVRGSWR
jgi:hypothetical protein